ncbi:MAG: SufD family Fe-S cluster assembly protein [Nitrososphaerota archaeon]
MQIDEGRLREALGKPAEHGEDLDLDEFEREPGVRAEVDEDVKRRSLEVGVDLGKASSLTTFLQVDHEIAYRAIQKQFQGDIELMPIQEAVEKHPWVREHLWSLVSPYADKYTAYNALKSAGGFFLRILEGRRLHMPIQACFLSYSPGIIQSVHNIIVAEPGSEACVITGCTMRRRDQRGLHIGVTEIFIGPGARLNYTMVHRWGPSFHVRPRTGIALDEGAVLSYNYVLLGAVGSFQSKPSAVLKGGNAAVSMNNVIYLDGSSKMDLGGDCLIAGRGCRAELITSAVASGRAKLAVRGRVVCDADDGRGHISCRGLMLSDEAEVYAIPELVSRRMSASLTHEAAIGRISEDQLVYLMARGFSREEAESIIVRGFLDVSSLNLPSFLEESIKKIIDLAVKGF